MNEEDFDMEELLAYEAEAEEEARLMAEIDEEFMLLEYEREFDELYYEDIDEW